MDESSKILKLGDYCELLVLLRLAREGYTIAMPYGNQKGWDFLVEVDGKWEKWQVKAAKKMKPHYKSVVATLGRSRLLSNGKRVTKQYIYSDFDILIAVEPDTGRMWKVPIKRVAGRTAISLSPSSEFRW